MSTPLSVSTKFITDSVPATPVSYRHAHGLFHAGHHPINPALQENGLIEYERGAAAIGATPHGELILLTTTDIDDLRLEHRFVTADGKIKTVAEENLEISPEKRDIDKDLLHDGSKYLGAFIARQTFSNGDTNYNHILGIAAWKPTPQQLIHSLINQFSAYHRQDLLDSGILMRQNEFLWTSREMVFSAKPNGHKNEDSEELYTLETLIAPDKGWDAAKLYHENFSTPSEKFVTRLTQSFMRAACGLISSKKHEMTLPEIEAHVKDVFSRDAKLLRQGKSTYMYNSANSGKKITNGEWAKGRIRHAFSSSVFGLGNITWKDLAVGVALPASIALGGTLFEHEELGLTMAAAPLGIMAARFGFLWTARSRQNFEHNKFNDLIHHFWPEGTKEKNIPFQFEMIHPKVLAHLRILPPLDLHHLSRIPSNRNNITPEWKKLYVIGTQNGPYGSHASFHKIGDQWVVRVDEDETNSGMNIEYWVQQEVAFARNATSDHLPQKLLTDFKAHPDKIQMVSIIRDEKGDVIETPALFITEEEYRQKTAELSFAPSRDVYFRPKQNPEFCSDYPLGEIKDSHHEGEESEWEADSKAATMAEVIAEGLKALLKGPHI